MSIFDLTEGSTSSSKRLGPVSVLRVETTGYERVLLTEPIVWIRLDRPIISFDTIDGKRLPEKRWEIGSVCFQPAGTELNCSPSPYSNGTAIRLHGDLLERAAGGIVPFERLDLVYSDITDAAVFAYSNAITAMALAPDIGDWPLLVDSAAMSLGVSVVRKLAEAGGMQAISQHSPMCDLRMRRVCEYVEANLSKRIGLQDLADVAALSQYHFSRQFTEKAGISPLRYVMARRVELAKRELLRPGASIAEVAYACGFSGQSHFTTAFKAAVGTTPGEYRRANGISSLAA